MLVIALAPLNNEKTHYLPQQFFSVKHDKSTFYSLTKDRPPKFIETEAGR